MNVANDSAYYMQYALQIAEKGRTTVSPNPMVGCVIVKNNCIVGEGYHVKAGHPHAEIYALQAAGNKAEGATVYIALEPCCHFGRTPPCTDALINAKVKKVVIPCLDPNPLVAGKGVEILRAAGIEVEVGLEAERAIQLNELFFHYMKHRRPFVILKWAMSLDGKTIAHTSDSRQISGIEAQHHTHQLRREVDAILVGANTAIRDDPLLTARLNKQPEDDENQPLRIIVSSQNTLPLNLKVFDTTLPGKTLIATTRADGHRQYKALIKKGIEVLSIPMNNEGLVSLPSLLEILGSRGITSILVEGGMSLQHNFIKEHLVNKIHVYLANVLIGTVEKKIDISNVTMNTLGTDFHFIGYYPKQ